MTIDEAKYYRAILARDQRFDGRFFTGVVTTGVYCRVVCPVPRPPKPQNMRFFPTGAAAEDAGFRPCRTCHPERSPGTPSWSDFPPVVSRALALIAGGALDEGGVEELSARLGLTARHLRRLFDQHLATSPVSIAKARRTHFARRLIDETELTFAEIAFASGFRSIRQFNHDFLTTFGQSPADVRRRRPHNKAGDPTIEIKLPYRPPLDWPRMIRFLQGRAMPGVEVVEHKSYRRTIEVDGAAAAIEIRVVPTDPYLTLRAWLPSSRGLIRVSERARRIFDLDADPIAIADGLSSSPIVGALVRRRKGLRPPGSWDPFEVAVRAVLGQQISVRAATTLAGRLVDRFGKPMSGPELPGLTHLFPEPEALASADLRQIGASAAQSATIVSLAAAVADGKLNFDSSLGLEEWVERACRLRGIGPWTAHYIAMRALGEPDAFPASDLGLRKAAGDGSSPVSMRELVHIAEEWRPWRAYAAIYLWTSQATRGNGKERK